MPVWIPIPDFEHQAISRAHRFGQKKPCLVFRFMGKQTAEGVYISFE